ncbi:hypothetical protein Pcinc_017788 [Petrolisthes cinctipes]|uniref:RING-type domain-containing protein n=1 Tax=Petrolisthes cinctipes TaxID=88211 RepID=A0AAE1FPZ7_PETCI|nr:hypothetical protein Pcinc_017788 [Petrolisthes cinctipes]
MAEGEVNCIICLEVFEENGHMPRTLRCGHTLCTPCLAALLERPPNQRSCPECRHPIKITSVDHVAVSYTVLRLARALEQAQGAGLSIRSGDTCPSHSRPFSAWCKLAKRWVCPRCKCHPSCSQLVPLKEAVLNDKRQTVKDTEDRLASLENIKGKLRERRDKLVKQLDEVNTALTRLGQVISGLEETEAHVVNAATPTTLSRANARHKPNMKAATELLAKHSTQDSDPDPDSTEPQPSESPDISPATPSPSPPLNGIITPEALKEKLSITQNLYAEREWCGEKKYARITLQGSDLCMHTLENNPPPEDAYIISFWPIRQQWVDCQQRAFLDLTIGDRVEGRLEVLLFNRSVRAETFCDLCVGEMGYTYKGLRLHFKVAEASLATQLVVGEEFQGEDGAVHAATSYHVSQYRDGGYYRRQVFPGLVSGVPAADHSRLAFFRVHMFHTKGRTDMYSFGKVEAGLSLIRQAFNDQQNKVSLIADCGLLFRV